MKQEIICGIYKITSPSGKIYIGESKDIEKRWSIYKKLKCKSQRKLYNSFSKYGVNNHIFEIIEECLFEDLKCRERHWQDFYDVLDQDKGLNLRLTECEEVKQVPSEETRKKISEANRGKVRSDECRKHLSNLNKGKKSPRLGKKNSQESIDRMRIAHKGKVLSDKHRHSIKLSLNGGARFFKKVIDVNTLEIFESVKEAAEKNNINYSSLRDYLSGKTKNKTTLLLLEEYEKKN